MCSASSSSSSAAVRKYYPFAILAATLGLVVAYARPGVMGVDALYQMWQARSGHYGNWHPPAMAALWSLLDPIVRGPLLMLIVQAGAFIAGLYAVIRQYHAPLRAAIITACIAIYPPVFCELGVICKDVLWTGLYLAGAAALAANRKL